MSDLKLAIFDIDGTLVDSRQIIAEAMDRAFQRAGLGGMSYERTRTIVGLELTEAVGRLAPIDYPPDKKFELAHLYKQSFVEMRSESGFNEPLYKGAIEIIQSLTNEGWLLGVATGKARRGLDFVFEHHGLQGYFQTFQTVDNNPGKPNPDMIFQAMKDTGVERDQTVMIGDTRWDMLMARNANVRALGVDWGFHLSEEIYDGGAHEVHTSFASLKNALDRFGNELKKTVASNGYV